MDNSSELGDSIVPEYTFVWTGGFDRNTAELPTETVPAPIASDAVEILAMLGREDPDCDVALTGFS